MEPFLEALKLILHIVTAIGVALSAYWSRKDLVLTRRVKKTVEKLPPVIVEHIDQVLQPIAAKITGEIRDDAKRNPT